MKKVPKLKIDIRNQADDADTAVIDIDGEIGWASWDGEDYTWNTPEAIKKKLREIEAIKASKIVVNINSLGGYVNDGLAIHDSLAMHPATIETRVIGMTASAATIIAQAGDVRMMSDNALYLIHRSWGLVVGNKHTMLDQAEELEVIDNRMLSIYTKRSGKDEADILALMEDSDGTGKWISAEEAEEMGLIDERFEPMSAAASVTRGQFKNLGLPDVPKSAAEFAEEKESSKVNATVTVDGEDFLSQLDERISEFKGIEKQENEEPKGESEEVAPEGISRFEAQLKVNSNYK